MQNDKTGFSSSKYALFQLIFFQAHSVHPGGVYSLALTKSGKLLSGGKDRMISEWDVNDLVRSRRPIELPDEKGFPRVILQSGSDLIIGTSSNSLLHGNPENPSNLTSLIEVRWHLEYYQEIYHFLGRSWRPHLSFNLWKQ